MLILRRIGRGNWSPIRVAYDPKRQDQFPTPLQARVGQRLELFGVQYRVSEVVA